MLCSFPLNDVVKNDYGNTYASMDSFDRPDIIKKICVACKYSTHHTERVNITKMPEVNMF